ncbi:hypothetical protein RZS08_66620, partial [Arthrospira platensis SPKY1]|nr:hypothetical protein [Arthrospira platensis SPKY1]
GGLDPAGHGRQGVVREPAAIVDRQPGEPVGQRRQEPLELQREQERVRGVVGEAEGRVEQHLHILIERPDLGPEHDTLAERGGLDDPGERVERVIAHEQEA